MVFLSANILLLAFLHGSHAEPLDGEKKLDQSFHGIVKRQSSCKNDSEVIVSLLQGYNKHGVPENKDGLLVKVEMWVQNVVSVSDLASNFEIDTLVTEVWMDRQLSFGDMNSCSHNISLTDDIADRFWSPKMAFINSKQADVQESPIRNTHFIILPNGTVTLMRRLRVKGPCNADYSSFPKDEVRCSLVYESYPYNSDTVRSEWTSNAVQFSSDSHAPEQFTLDNFTAHRSEVAYQFGRWDELSVTFIFKRRYGWSMINFYFPTGLILVANWASVGLGVRGNGARMLMHTGSIVAVWALYKEATKDIPRISHITAMGNWLLMCFVLLILSVIELSIISCITGLSNSKRCNGCDGELLTSHRDDSGPYEKFITEEQKRRPHVHKGRRSKTVWWMASTVDKIFCLLLLPLAFIAFNIWYWTANMG